MDTFPAVQPCAGVRGGDRGCPTETSASDAWISTTSASSGRRRCALVSLVVASPRAAVPQVATLWIESRAAR